MLDLKPREIDFSLTQCYLFLPFLPPPSLSDTLVTMDILEQEFDASSTYTKLTLQVFIAFLEPDLTWVLPGTEKCH